MPDKIYCSICEEEIAELPCYDDESRSLVDQEGQHYETLSDWYNEVTALWNESESSTSEGTFICKRCADYYCEQKERAKNREIAQAWRNLEPIPRQDD